MTVQEQLARLHRRATKYEVILVHRDHPSILVLYTGRKSKQGLLDALRRHGEHVVKLIGLSEECRVQGRSQELHFDNGWICKFSGRTQREAIVNGERPFCLDLEEIE